MSSSEKPNTAALSTTPRPVIPEKYLDVPTQRLYYLSLGLLCQALKVVDFFAYLTHSGDTPLTYGRKWLIIDFAYCVVLARLHIPRLNYSKAVVFLQIALLWFLDGMLFGGISLHMAGQSSDTLPSHAGYSNIPATPPAYSLLDFLSPLSFGLITASSSGTGDPHLRGQLTVRMSPISTAQLHLNGNTFCLASPGDSVLIPILLNNTNPYGLRYSLTPLGYTEDGGHGKVEYFDLSAKDLKAIEQSRVDSLPLVRQAPSGNPTSDEYDEYDDDGDDSVDANDAAENQNSQTRLQRTQSLAHIRLTKPGTLRLERIVDSSNVDARLSYPTEITVVPCPYAEFVDDPGSDLTREDVRCAGQDLDLQLTIGLKGVPPLSLKWFKVINGKREHLLVEGIEGGTDPDHPHMSNPNSNSAHIKERSYVPQTVKVPLTVALDSLGTHVYALEEVMDAIGNVVRIGSDPSSPIHPDSSILRTKSTRSVVVLRRPTMSFKYCRPGSPASFRIGSEALLTISANEADAFDAPWETIVKYQPPLGLDVDNKVENKRFKPWNKTLTTQNNRKELVVRANAPGEYTIVGVKGKWCEGDVLAPETCKVVEEPLPTAEIEWKKIHECSGDTGVSASLVLHGTPPFHVQYRTQRDKEHPREDSKTFAGSRGELTLQPERSGHYVYTFFQISDANYKKVELNGPSIDQVVHPLATADFVSGQRGVEGNRRKISSCEGSLVDVDVDLRGTGPWNLQAQVVGPKGSDTLTISNITTARTTLQVPIPKVIDRDGGTFEIDLVSIEDAYGCKRSVSVPGIIVNVRRVKPTVKFYSKDGNRQVTVLEHEQANLPLRLTGDGPWRIKYRRVEAEHPILTATLTSPNEQLRVSDRGTYEILELSDSQCPGSVIADGSTYTVNWLPRPSAKLSANTDATYMSHNGSHILPPVCEGIHDHVDLDLTGRPPFEIMYNVAQESEVGGTKLLDQPTFNSIQAHTRFQLHTSHPGRMYYEVKQIGDATYPLSKHKNAVIPRSERLLFEQQVSMRPSARFKNGNSISYCLYSPFVPRDPLSGDGIVLLEGTPPFHLQLSIKNVAASHVDTRTVQISEAAWKIDLPSYEFTSIGSHIISIDSVQDASNCAQAMLDPSTSSITVHVAETAAIVPFDRREDFCVGEVLQFQLEGIPPWTIGYRINGKSYTQEAKVSPFLLLQQQPGEFTITSIAHQQTMCKAAVTDLRFNVHPLPSAQIANGKRVYQDIHEGDQAEIVFKLFGEPPFTFTYQRAEPSPPKGGRPGKVLETHTVSRVNANEYSIYSALEGTWTVTSISDRFCRYPQSQPDIISEQKKH